MSKLTFFKYSGTGNDFVVIDNRKAIYSVDDVAYWNKVCDRKFGVGADGVLFLNSSEKYDYKMIYLNADGGEVSMCGNGSRCLAHYAATVLGLGDKKNYTFETKKGVYKAHVDGDYVKVLMSELYDVDAFDVSDLYKSAHAKFMNTGVPHCIYENENLDSFDLQNIGAKIRYDKRFPEGTNANFFKVVEKNHIKLRTYERGVEGETLACGTGATAAALACSTFFGWKNSVQVDMPGGSLTIEFSDDHSEVYLCGQVEKIFSGALLF